MSDAMNHWRSIHRRKNVGMLYAEDLGPAGTAVDVFIDESGTVEVTGADGKSTMPYIAKKGLKKLGLNATNCKTLETITGTADWMEWRGWFTFVVIRTKYPDKQTKQKMETDAIRIAADRPKRDAPPASRGQRDAKPANAPAGDVTPDEAAAIARDERERLEREGQS